MDVSHTLCRLRPERLFRLSILLLLNLSLHSSIAQTFFPLKDVYPGLRGNGRTVFNGNRIEEFEVEILGVLENLTPKQAIILAKLSGGPLEQTGVMQGMSGSPVYIDGKLLGAIALGFPFSKQPIAGIQPIEQMVADSPSPVSGKPDGRHSSSILTRTRPRSSIQASPLLLLSATWLKSLLPWRFPASLRARSKCLPTNFTN